MKLLAKILYDAANRPGANNPGGDLCYVLGVKSPGVNNPGVIYFLLWG